MSDSDCPAKVYVLAPRMVSVSTKLDRFLNEQNLTPSNNPKPRVGTRPNTDNLNAMHCATCGQVEYLTRDYCRCGHYLRGQLEDEYLAWGNGVDAEHNTLSEETERKLKPLRFLVLLGLAFFLIPILHLTFLPDSFSLGALFWMLPALLIFGVAALIEKHLKRPLEASILFINNYTFEAFLKERHFRPKAD